MNRLCALLVVLLAVPAPSWAGSEAPEDSKAAQILYLKATLLERQGSYQESLEAFEAALKADPGSAYICREAADLALEMGSLDKALVLARKAVDLDPKAAASLMLLGRVQWARGDSRAAEASFEAALKLDPRSVESLFSLGTILAAKAPQKARELLLGFLKENPAQAADIRVQLAKIELEAGRLAEAEKELAAALAASVDADVAQVRYGLAQAYEVQRDTEQALAQYLEINKLEARNPALLTHIGQLYALLGRWDEARAQFLAAHAAAPGDHAINHWLALDAERRGDFAQAADYLVTAAAVMDDPGLSLRLGYYLTQANRLKEAVVALERAHERWPKNDQVAYFLALGYQDLKRDRDAIRILRKVLELKPDYRDARYQLAVLLERASDMKDAETEFRALLAQKGDDAQILNYLGYSLADRGLKLDEAEELIRAALRQEPANGAYQDSLGWVHYKQGRSTEAVKELLGALAQLPSDESIWDHLGDAYAASGQKASAWFAWKKAQSLAGAGSRVPAKAADLQKRFAPEELAQHFLELLRVTQGGLKRLSALCEVRGEVKGKGFAYSGMLTYKAPGEVGLELLGPFFTPMFRLKLDAGGFAMDPLRLEGVPPETVAAAGRAAASSLRAYLTGAVFTDAPARYRRTWRSRELLVPGWRLRLDDAETLVVSLMPDGAEGAPLALSDFSRVQGRQIPGIFRAEGPGFFLEIKLKSVNAEMDGAWAPPRAPAARGAR